MLSVSEASEKRFFTAFRMTKRISLGMTKRISLGMTILLCHAERKRSIGKKRFFTAFRMTKRISLGMTTYVMLSVSEASEKEILHCVQNDGEDKLRNDNPPMSC